MADVRLTATNPEDSSVVPVACNEKGELKLEEPLVVEGPPGEKGEKGDPGDPFSGNFADDVTFEGSASFVGKVGINRTVSNQATLGVDISNQDTGIYVRPKGNQTDLFAFSVGQLGKATASLLTRGELQLGDQIDAPNVLERVVKVRLKNDGSATFANNKAGFTAEGYLWCTTQRGDTVKLVGTSNGMALWEDYTPPTRRDEIKEGWAEKDGIRPMPEESFLDEPKTPQ